MIYSTIIKTIDKLAESVQILTDDVDSISTQIRKIDNLILDCNKAKTIINEVALQTQVELTEELESIVNVCLATLPDPYIAHIEYEIKRNVTEVSIKLERDGEIYDPVAVCGGGIVDLFSFALRLSFISLSNDSFHCIILDEPFKNISKNLLPPICDLLKMLSKQMKLQILMVTHTPELAAIAERVFECEIRNGTTKISVL